MLFSTALAKLLDFIGPMFQYLGGNGNIQINEEKIKEFCADIENRWLSLNFSFTPSSDEVVKYFNFRNKTDDNRDLIVSEYDYANCELYIFLKYLIMITALDSYGRCETIEGSQNALERGKQALQTGVLISHFKKLPPWTKHFKEFEGWRKIIPWIINVHVPFGTSYTKQEYDSPDKERVEIGEQWKKELQKAFEQN